MKIDTHDIKKVLESDASTYEISKEIEVNRSTIHFYRSGKASIENMTISLAKKLQKYYEKNDKK